MANDNSNSPDVPNIAKSAEGVPAPTSGPKVPRQVTSTALLQGDREIQILHGEEVYRLSLTRQGKLILHK